jgi:hypothetical protein
MRRFKLGDHVSPLHILYCPRCDNRHLGIARTHRRVRRHIDA